MRFITPKRSTKHLERGFIYEVLSEVDNSGSLKVLQKEMVIYETLIPAGIHFIHKNNAKEVNRT